MPGRVDRLTMINEEITEVKRTVTDKITGNNIEENYSNKTCEFITSNDRNLLVVVRQDSVLLLLKADEVRNEHSIEFSPEDFRELCKLGLAD